MVETRDTSRKDGAQHREAAALADADAWFVREILPFESALTQFLYHNWRNKGEIADLRQDIYVKIYAAALQQTPEHVKSFLFTVARNLLITRVRDENIIPIETVADLDALGIPADVPGPERNAIARDALRRLQVALDRLPNRCREAVAMRKIDGLSVREIATRMGISEKTVKRHLTDGVRALANLLYTEPTDFRGQP